MASWPCFPLAGQNRDVPVASGSDATPSHASIQPPVNRRDLSPMDDGEQPQTRVAAWIMLLRSGVNWYVRNMPLPQANSTFRMLHRRLPACGTVVASNLAT